MGMNTMVKKFFLALLGGLGLVTSAMAAAPVFQYRSSSSDLERIRADVQRVGEDMAKVIEREHAKART